MMLCADKVKKPSSRKIVNPMKTRRHKKRRSSRRFALILLLAAAGAVVLLARQRLPAVNPDPLAAFAEANDLEISDYPESMVALLERNPETLDFVLHYPLEYGKEREIDLSDDENSQSVPLFMQWDRRWGYIDYGSDVAGITGCGPVCLAMAGYSLTGDEETFRPDKVIAFALEGGYCEPGSGTSWTLISEGGVKLGLDVTELPLDKSRIIRNLEVDNPIICVMGPGAFTTDGHYIVLTGLEDGKFKVNDPNSRANSGRLWRYEEIQDQIQNLWAIRK